MENTITAIATSKADRACDRTHGTAVDLLSLIPGPNPSKAKGDPFITLSPRLRKRGWRSSRTPGSTGLGGHDQSIRSTRN